MDMTQAAALFGAATIGGALNSVAGGGSFVTFPSLLAFHAGQSIPCNITSTVALWPGSLASAWAYRSELQSVRRQIVLLSGASIAGGLLGAWILVGTKPATFDRLLPWLLLMATVVFAAGPALNERLRSRSKGAGARPAAAEAVVLSIQFGIAIYGGFFGGGASILMLAALALMGMTEIHAMNALKAILAALINGVAVALFIAGGRVMWGPALVMVAGAILGAYLGATYARGLPPARVRQFVIAVGVAMTVVFFLRSP